MTLEDVLEQQKALEEERKKETRKDPGIAVPPPPRHTIGFSTFFMELLDREKLATTRQPRGIHKGDTLSCYWEKNTDMMLKSCHWLYDATVIEVIPWQLPPSPRTQSWEDIYRHTLLRDVYWPELDGREPRGWTSREAYQMFLDWYGPGVVLETIRFQPCGALPSPREVLLTKRLYLALQMGQERWKKEQAAKEQERAKGFFQEGSMKKRKVA